MHSFDSLFNDSGCIVQGKKGWMGRETETENPLYAAADAKKRT